VSHPERHVPGRRFTALLWPTLVLAALPLIGAAAQVAAQEGVRWGAQVSPDTLDLGYEAPFTLEILSFGGPWTAPT
jgi:hypothetical protein